MREGGWLLLAVRAAEVLHEPEAVLRPFMPRRLWLSRATISAVVPPCTPSAAPPPPPQTEHMNAGHWRKSSQFLGLTRPHAAAVLDDTEVYRS